LQLLPQQPLVWQQLHQLELESDALQINHALDIQINPRRDLNEKS
jgi:hypothetical protein